MKFSVAREELLKPLQVAHSVVERRQTLPILSNVHVKTDGDGLLLTATDLEVELSARTGVLSGDSSVETTIPARKLLDLCRASPEGSRLDFDVSPERVVIRAGRARFTLIPMAAAEFPGIDVGEARVEFEISQGALRSLLEKAYFAMAQQDVRYYLNGMLLEVMPGGQRVVATDGHRMAINSAGDLSKAEDVISVIVPRKTVIEVMRLLGDSEDKAVVSVGGDHLTVVFDGLRFKSKLIDGAFPEYERVIPRSADKTLIADRLELREVLGRVAIFSNEKYRAVRLDVNEDRLRVAANNAENEEAEEEMAVEYHGAPVEVGFNVNYIVDALGAMRGDVVEIQLSDPNSSCLLKEPGEEQPALYVIMPMRL